MGILSKETPAGDQRKHAWDPSLAGPRKQVLKTVLTCFALTSLATYLIQSLYFGSYFRQTENAYRLTVRILDLDSQYAAQTPGAPAAVLGPAIVRAAQNNAQSSPHYHLGWQYAGAEELSTLKLTPSGQGLNASDYARSLVLDQTVFAAILIQPNATALATEAALQGSTAYDPRGAIAFMYEEARNFYSENQYISFLGSQVIRSGISEASAAFVSSILSNAAANATAVTTAIAGNALTTPFSYSEFNLRPFDQLAGEAATTAGQIYLIIFTFFQSPIWKAAFEPFRKHLKTSSDLFLRVAVPILAYWWISLNYSLVTLAFNVDFTRKYGYGGFPLFWAINWVSMTALGLVMEAALSLLGPLGFPFFLAFWVIWNVSVAFLDIADEDHFYSYGFAFPVWNSIDTAKSIMFGTKNHLLQNFAVNLGWIFFGIIALLSIGIWHRRSDRDQHSKKDSKVAELRHGKEQQMINSARLDEREKAQRRESVDQPHVQA